jgi:hypothetical protein
MLKAAEEVLNDKHPDAHVYAQGAFQMLAEAIFDIHTKTMLGRITPEHARVMLRIGRNTALAVLLAVKGLSHGAAEATVSAALATVRADVNEAIGWRLL